MKEKIYTIPVTDVFREDCECPICELEKRLEEEYLEYFLGASLMEPDCRIITNENGFCARHFEKLYNKQENRLGLGLTIHTHMNEKLEHIRNSWSGGKLSKNSHASFKSSDQNTSGAIGSILTRLFRKRVRMPDGKQASEQTEKLIQLLKSLEDKCSICNKLSYTMGRYIDVVFHLWSREKDFRELFSKKKGFCLKHFRILLEASTRYLGVKESEGFNAMLFAMEIEHLERIEKEVEWFTKKFDYRNQDAPWGNSKDAITRSIQKLKGYFDLK